MSNEKNLMKKVTSDNSDINSNSHVKYTNFYKSGSHISHSTEKNESPFKVSNPRQHLFENVK